MARRGTLVHVFVAGPEDCRREKAAVIDAILRLNGPRLSEEPVGLLPVVDHLHTRPQMGGRPQHLLNKQLLNHCDLLVAVFKERLGTRTGRSESGTADEIRGLMRKGKEVLVYFKKRPKKRPIVRDQRQFRRLTKFKEAMRARGLVKEFSSVNDLSKQVLSHLPGAIETTLSPRARLPRGSRRRTNARSGRGERQLPDLTTFAEDFSKDLSHWEGAGGWSVRTEDGTRILVVEESATGGIAVPCHGWRDYVFEFETRIVRRCSSWVVRAADRDNYIMLQCGVDAIRPHFRRGGIWFPFEPGVPLSPPLPIGRWFSVRIVVNAEAVSATATVDGLERTLVSAFPTQGDFRIRQVAPTGEEQESVERFSFPQGSVGFREWGDLERADFKGIRVTRMR